MADDLVLRTDEGRVVTLTLNRPGKLNAIDLPTMSALREHVEELHADPVADCVVLAGAGRSFCAGHDIAAVKAKSAERSYFEQETIDRFEGLPMPTIGRIQGHCLTGGLELALSCDILICTENARFGDTHGRWGLIPVWGMSVRLPERVGVSAAKRLMFTSELISGHRACELGLVDRCVREEDLDSEIRDLALAIVANSSGTNRIVKGLFADQDGRSRRESLLWERSEPLGRPTDREERLAAWQSKAGR